MQCCDFTPLDGPRCDQIAKYMYVFCDDDGGERYFYERCLFHPVDRDEHDDEGLMRYTEPLEYNEAAFEAHLEQIAQWSEEHHQQDPFNERIS